MLFMGSNMSAFATHVNPQNLIFERLSMRMLAFYQLTALA